MSKVCSLRTFLKNINIETLPSENKIYCELQDSIQPPLVHEVSLVRKMIASKTWLLILLVLAVDSSSVSDNHTKVLKNQREGTSMFEPHQEHVTNECARRLTGLYFDTTEAASQALDAFGRPEAGLLVNNREWLGHFSECSHLEDFKYCLLTVNVTAYTALPDKTRTYLIKWGVCVPQPCSYEDLHNDKPTLLDLSTYILHGFYVNSIYEDMFCYEDPVISYSVGFYITVIIFIIIGTLMIAGSIFDVIERKFTIDHQARDQSVETIPLIEDQHVEDMVDSLENSYYSCKWFFRRIASTSRLVLLDFALNRNLKKLLHVGEGDERNIRCLHGIRVISMFWVILGHVILVSFSHGVFNLYEFAEWKKHFFFQTLLLNFVFAVDSFFFLSGLLVCFTTLSKLEATNGRYPWHWFYFHRYIRLSPPMLVAIMIYMYISPYFIWGPNAKLYVNRNDCESYWWTNLIYINNIYPWQFWHTCMGWTWYLASDMQFFIISPLIILSFRRIYWLGFAIISAMLAISFVVTGTLVAIFNFNDPVWALMHSSSEYANVIYSMPYARIPPYLVGMALGYILFKQKGKRVTIPRPLLLAGWLIASAVAVLLLCGTITLSSSTDNSNDMSNTSSLSDRQTESTVFIPDHHTSALGSVVYEMLSRFAWGLFLSWIVIACQFGGPGWVNDILGWSFWEPLSRMNYNAYLLHVIVLIVFYGNFGLSVYVSRVLMTFYYCGAVFLSYIFAMVLTLAVEMPISNMERRFMHVITEK